MKVCTDGYPSCRKAEATGTECMTDCLAELERDLADCLEKRDAIRAKQFSMYATNSFSRPKTTTMNARASQINDRIVWLRGEIKKQSAA